MHECCDSCPPPSSVVELLVPGDAVLCRGQRGSGPNPRNGSGNVGIGKVGMEDMGLNCRDVPSQSSYRLGQAGLGAERASDHRRPRRPEPMREFTLRAQDDQAPARDPNRGHVEDVSCDAPELTHWHCPESRGAAA
jgi:hypothetical protein